MKHNQPSSHGWLEYGLHLCALDRQFDPFHGVRVVAASNGRQSYAPGKNVSKKRSGDCSWCFILRLDVIWYLHFLHCPVVSHEETACIETWI